ncbi:MAG: hypothetical protein RIF32_17290 [Leptospirales bacterium]|jgi:hypothetical protein
MLRGIRLVSLRNEGVNINPEKNLLQNIIRKLTKVALLIINVRVYKDDQFFDFRIGDVHSKLSQVDIKRRGLAEEAELIRLFFYPGSSNNVGCRIKLQATSDRGDWNRLSISRGSELPDLLGKYQARSRFGY